MNAWPPREGRSDFNAQIRTLRRFVERWGAQRVAAGAVVVAVLLWLISGVYVVGPGERGIVLLFGRVIGQTESGLRYRLPTPIATPSSPVSWRSS